MHEFHPFRLDSEKMLLYKDDRRLEVEERVVQLLNFLISRSPETVTRRDLLDHLWPMQEVGDASLTQLIRRARVALGDDDQDHQYIKTVHGIGLRWLDTPAITDDGRDDLSPRPSSSAASRWRRNASGVFAGLIAFALAFWFAIPHLKQDRLELMEPGYPQTIAILPFINVTGDDRNNWVQLGLMDMVSQMLDESAGINVISPAQVLSYLSNQPADYQSRSAEEDDALFDKIAGALGCDLVLLGEVGGQPEPDVISYRLITARGAFPKRRITGKAILNIASDFANAVIKQVDPAQPWLVDVSHTYSQNSEANQAYGIGVQALLDGKLQIANQYLQIALSQQADFHWAKVRKADVSYRLAEMESAATLVEQLLAVADLVPEIRFQALHVKSNILYAQGKLESSRKLTRELLTEAKNRDRPILVGQEQMNIGTTSLRLGELTEAESWLEKSRQSFGNAGYMPGLAQVTFNLGNVYLSQNQYRKALAHYQRAVGAFANLGNGRYRTFSQAQSASALRSLEQYTGARTMLNQVVAEYQKLGDVEGELLARLDLAQIDQLEGQIREGNLAIEAILTEIDDENQPYVRHFAYRLLSYGYLKLSQPEEARKWMQEDSEIDITDPSFTLLQAMLAWEEKRIDDAVNRATEIREEAAGAWLSSHQKVLDEMKKAQGNRRWQKVDF